MKILLATSNIHKAEEIKKILSNHEIITLRDLNDYDEVVEDGLTFEENAYIKAKHYYDKYKMNIISDDSGIEVDALNGVPGIYSARYAGEKCTYKQNRDKLLLELGNNENRSARFICSICFIDENENVSYFNGYCEGEILKEEIGENTFGYDCIFYSYDLKKSFGEATEEEKNIVSHRGRAVKEFLKSLK